MDSLLTTIFQLPVAYAQKATSGDVTSETTDQITGLVGFIIGQIPLWITAIFVLIASFIIAKMVKAGVESKMTAEGFEEEHKEVQIVASRTASAAVLIIGITVALKIAGIDLTPIIAAGAFGMGFALQDLIMNFVAGVMILSGRQITIGDIIQVNGTMGKVVEIQTRATVLKAFNGTKIMVPNADLFKNQVTNFSANPYKRIQLMNGVAYGSDLKQTMKVVLDTVKSTQGVLAIPKPSVVLYEWGDYSINFKINAWVEKGKGMKVRNRLIINIAKALEDAGIEMPYPIQTVYLSKDGKDDQIEKMVMEERGNKPLVASPAVTEPNIITTAAATEIKVEAPVQTPEWLKKAQQGLEQAPVIAVPAPMGTLNVQPEVQIEQPVVAPAPVAAAPITTVPPTANSINIQQ